MVGLPCISNKRSNGSSQSDIINATLQESAHSVATIKHSMDRIKEATHVLNQEQTPVMAVDQPLFASAKQIQWQWPESYGEDKFVVMFGGLHIEMAALKVLGDLLKWKGLLQMQT